MQSWQEAPGEDNGTESELVGCIVTVAINSQFKHLIEVRTREHYCPQRECSSCQIDFVYNLVQWDAGEPIENQLRILLPGGTCVIYSDFPNWSVRPQRKCCCCFCFCFFLSRPNIILLSNNHPGKIENNSNPLEFIIAYIPKLNHGPKKVLKLHLMKTFGTH